MATKIDVIGWQNLYCSAGSSVNEYVNIRQSYSTNSAIIGQLKKTDRYKVLSYGYKTGESDAEKWYAIQMPGGQIGYCRKDLLQFYTITDKDTYTDADLKTFLGDIVAVNKSIYLRLLQCSVLLEDAAKAGQDQKKLYNYAVVLRGLNDRLAARQQELETSTYLKCKTAFESAWDKAYSVYKRLLSNISGIGVAPVVIGAVVVAIAAVAGVSAYAIYQALKPKYDASVTDLKQSDELKLALSTLTADQQNKVVEDLEKQIDDAYNEGRKDAAFSGAWAVIKPLAFAAAGWYLIQLFIDKQKRKG